MWLAERIHGAGGKRLSFDIPVQQNTWARENIWRHKDSRGVQFFFPLTVEDGHNRVLKSRLPMPFHSYSVFLPSNSSPEDKKSKLI